MDFKQIKKAVDILNENSLTEFSYESKEGMKLTLRKDIPQQVISPQSVGSGSTPALENVASSPAHVTSEKTVNAPLVGTFYSAPNPDAPAYVKVGDSFKKGDILCIVESMKVMNEVKAEYDGVISKILIQDGEAVEYNQPLFEYK